MFRLPIAAVLLALLLAGLALPAPTFAQSSEDVPDVTRTYAITNARIVQAPGRIIERGTVILRDGLILAVGPNVAIPFDADRIEGDSLVVYAGFIDGLSNTAVPKPKEDPNRPQVDDPGNPPNDLAGIQPDQDVRTLLDAGDKSIDALRKAGFGAAHTVPYGRMLPGAGAIILLSGSSSDGMVLKGEASLFAQFQGARGVYPGTPMGMMAKFRQLYRESERLQRIEGLYSENPAGMERPTYDAVQYAFFPVLTKDLPVFFLVNDALEAGRALRLQKDLGFPLILGGLEQSFNLVEDLKAAGIPLFLTLELPKEPKYIAKVKQDSIETVLASFTPETRTATFRDLEAEKRNLEARQLMSRTKYLSTAATLHEAGLPFGFSTMSVKPDDIHGNVRLMIERGLPEEVALAALTTQAAAFLGLSRSLGTVEVGKIANLVITTAPYFEEDAKIQYVFVDGRKFEYDIKPKKKAAGGDAVAAKPAGSWRYSIETPQGAFSGTITISGAAGDWSGTISNDMSPDGMDLQEIELDGSTLSFAFDNPQMGRMTVEVTIAGDDMDGTLSSPNFSGLSLTATRSSGPDGR